MKDHVDRAGALVERARHQHDQRQPRAPVLSSSRRSRRRASARRPSTPTSRTPCARSETRQCDDCHVSSDGRQQRLDGAGADARHELRQLRRPLRLGRRRRGRHRGGRRHRVGRAAGGDRQQPAPHGVSRQLPAPPRPRPRAAGGVRAPRRRPHEPQVDVLALQLRGEYLYTANGPGRLPRLRRRQHRQQGLLRAHHHRSGLAARPARLRQDAASRPASRCRPTSRSTSAASTTRRTKSSRCTRSIAMPT